MLYLVDEYISQLSRVRSEKTLEFKRNALRFIEEIKDLSTDEVFRLYEVLRERTSHSTAMAYLSEIKRFYEWLREKGINVQFSEKALKEIGRKKELKGFVRKYFTEEEVRAILLYIRTRPFHPIYYIFCIFLLSSGLRLQEALSLYKKDIQVRKIITKTGETKDVYFVKVKGKFGKERETLLYFFDPTHEEVFEKYFKQLDNDDKLFTYQVQYPKSVKTLTLKKDAVFKVFTQIEKALGFPVHAHRFRYTFATWLATKGVPPNLLKELLGHSSIKTTMEIYAQAQKEKLLETLF